MPFIHTPDQVAWKVAFEHYNWDRMEEAWAAIEDYGVGEWSTLLGSYRLLEAEWMTRVRSKITRVAPWLQVEFVEDEIDGREPELIALISAACDVVAQRLSYSHGPETMVSVLAASADQPWATNPYGYCVDKHPYEKICLPHHLVSDPAQFYGAVAHEYAHVVSLNLSQGRASRWLSEAISVLVERPLNRYALRSFRSGRWRWRMPDELEGMFNVNSDDASGVSMAYAQAGLIGRYLADLGGESKLSGLLRDLAKNSVLKDLGRQVRGRSRVDASLHTIYGIGERELFEQAHESLRTLDSHE